jgi:putative tryptophan/tyrosine transport system substrate-binding protein
MAIYIRRREFIVTLGSAGAAWPLAARAEADAMRRIGVMVGLAESDPEGQSRALDFRQDLQRVASTRADRHRSFLISFSPDTPSHGSK